ncbi:DEAD H (Asp-Glu-Ala-Asp His) box helicase 11 [Thoreauomyces humboldtii]|nr:DEAD H (Asp-Glu-Ala-Asp His) box helicase 11 [Thoreauomyces humboldtii]
MSRKVPLEHTRFLFPFEPWSIQTQFMEVLYAGIEHNKVLVMESPTGTGKSLSLICGSFRWLLDYGARSEVQNVEELQASDARVGDDEPDWVKEFAQAEALGALEEEKEKKRKRAERLIELRASQHWDSGERNAKRAKTRATTEDARDSSDDEHIVVEFESDSEKILDPKFDLPSGDSSALEEAAPDELKVIYCSRTHSQISQFVHEIQKTAYLDIKSVSLGSRQSMCINESVTRLKSLPRINDRCLDLMKATKDAKGGCEYLAKDPNTKELFSDQLHVSVKDIEDIVDLGRRHRTCPYYGARHAIQPSQVVTLPYATLLQRSARDSYGIQLKGNIVIIDEAHNLVDAITSIYSVSLSLGELERGAEQLEAYLKRYQKRLKGKNIIYIRQILILIKALKKSLTGTSKSDASIKMVNNFVHELNIDNINLFKIGRYLSESRLGQKLQGFVQKVEQNNAEEAAAESQSTHVSAIQCVEAFLSSLTNADLEGRVVVTISADKPASSSLKYLLLNPANAFRQIVDEARAVVLAGGTMGPLVDIVDELFPYLPVDRLSHFSCGHVVPATSLLTVSVAAGPSRRAFEFKYDSRGDIALMDDLGSAVANLCNVVPGGVVCFFGSYDYLEKVHAHWSTGSTLRRISDKKQVFKEPRSASAVDATLVEYDQCIEDAKQIGATKTGAILLAVIGGKMSEGINFADDMGRLVIVVGLPFPNMRSVELQEKLKYVQARAALKTPGISTANLSNEYYENICMKAVNQSIGRAIRHKDDYAAIVLLDQRYGTSRIRKKLPGWITDKGVVDAHHFGQCVAEVAKFFRGKRQVERIDNAGG